MKTIKRINKEPSELDEINAQLNKTHAQKFPWWILIIVASFAIGFVFRYQIANWMRDTFRHSEEKSEETEITPSSGHTFVWDEPEMEVLMHEDIGPGYLLDKMDDHAILLDGQYYHLPCPIYRFVQHGWTVNTAGNTKNEVVYEVGDIPKIISLKKGDVELKAVTILSPTDNTVPIEDSFVTGLTIFSWNEVDFEMPKGLKIGMKKDTFLKTLEKDEVIPATSTDDQVEIRFPKPSWFGYSYYEITVKFKDDAVSQIRLELIK